MRPAPAATPEAVAELLHRRPELAGVGVTAYVTGAIANA